MKTYDTFQQVFGLSLASNIDIKCKGTTKALQKDINMNLPPCVAEFGNWDIVWGPVIWQSAYSRLVRGGPDNTWFVANNPSVTFDDGKSYNTYVVAIAGTATLHDWFSEDMGVKNVVDFNNWIQSSSDFTPPKMASTVKPGVPYVAYGTATAVYTLLSYQAPANAIAGAGKTLCDFLTSIAAQPNAAASRIVFTGHSLGGALAPTLALALVKAQKLGQFLSRNVLTYPTAGPTPGNSDFAQLFSNTFPNTSCAQASDYQVWNCNFANTLDCVPCAWNDLEKIKTIYGPLSKNTKRCVNIAIRKLEGRLPTNGMIYTPLQGHTFAGTIVPPPPPSTSPGDTIEDFKTQAIFQHTRAYTEHFKLTPLPKSSCSGNSKELSCMSEEEVLQNYPVIGDLERVSELDSKGDVDITMARSV